MIYQPSLVLILKVGSLSTLWLFSHSITFLSQFAHQAPLSTSSLDLLASLVFIRSFSFLGTLSLTSRICKICRKPNSKSKFLNSLNEILKVSAACERLLIFVIILVIMCHIVSCMWYFVAKIEENPQSWTNSFPDVTDDSEFYFIGVYFTITTITTVGYGDISAHTTGERILCSILMLIGVVGYSYAIGSLSSLMSTLDAKSAKLK